MATMTQEVVEHWAVRCTCPLCISFPGCGRSFFQMREFVTEHAEQEMLDSEVQVLRFSEAQDGDGSERWTCWLNVSDTFGEDAEIELLVTRWYEQDATVAYRAHRFDTWSPPSDLNPA